MDGTIYSLKDPRDGEIKYIGQTKFNINKRFSEHIRNSKYKNTKNHPVYLWINELLESNLTPMIEVVEIVGVKKLNQKEKYWISYYENLTNVTSGGSGIRFINKKTFSNEHRKKIGDSCRGKKHYNYGKTAHNRKSIIKYSIETGELIKKYVSIKLVSIDNNVSVSAISGCLNGRKHSSNEHIWLYENHSVEEYESKLVLARENPSNTRKSILVEQINIKNNKIIKIHNSIKEAARSVNSSDAALKYVCETSKTQKYRSFKWKYHEKKISK